MYKYLLATLLIIIFLALSACAGDRGKQGLTGPSGTACTASCDGPKIVVLVCPDTAIKFKVKKCELLEEDEND